MRRESVVESGHEETLSLTTQEIPAAWAAWSKNREKPGVAGESPEETEDLWGKSSHGLRVESRFCRTCEHRNHLVHAQLYHPTMDKTGTVFLFTTQDLNGAFQLAVAHLNPTSLGG